MVYAVRLTCSHLTMHMHMHASNRCILLPCMHMHMPAGIRREGEVVSASSRKEEDGREVSVFMCFCGGGVHACMHGDRGLV